MSALYEIQEGILSCIDLKTGEIIDVERLHELQMERRQKIRNIACWIKNLLADARAYEEEEKTFAGVRWRQRIRRTASNSICPTAFTGRRFRTRSSLLVGVRVRESILMKGLPFLRRI